MARYPQILSAFCSPLLALAFLTATSAAGHTEELGAPPDQPLGDELELLKEEETVSIASRYDQPISQAPSNVYVITDEDILLNLRRSFASDNRKLQRDLCARRRSQCGPSTR